MLSMLAGREALRPYCGAAVRRRAARVARHDEDRQRGRDPARASRRSTQRKARRGCAVIWRFAWSRCWPSRGCSTSTRRSSRSTAIRKAPRSVTIRRSPDVPAIAITRYSMASTRLILDVDVSPGDEHTSKHSAPTLVGAARSFAARSLAALLRGDAGFGVEAIMARGGGEGSALSVQAAADEERRRMIEKLAQSGLGRRRPGL